jgi:hypothetical protein
MQGASPCCILYCASDALLNGVGRHIVESSFFFFFFARSTSIYVVLEVGCMERLDQLLRHPNVALHGGR